MAVKLQQDLNKLKQGDHICLIYENTDQQLAVSAAFIMDGLACGERCICIIDNCAIEELVQALAVAGVGVEQERQRGALRMLTTQHTYLRSGAFVPQEMIEFVRQAEVDALADGFSGLRLAGEMTWALGPEPGCDRWVEFEALLNHLLTNSKSVVLGMYNQVRFGAPCIHDVFRTHPLVILGDQVCPNPYYEAPEMVLSKDQAATTAEFKAKRVDWWIAQLKRRRAEEQERERALEKLKKSEQRLAEAQRVASIGSWDRDLRTGQVSWSDEMYRLFGVKANEVELTYERFLSFVVPQDADRIRARVDQVVRECGPFDFDYRIRRADGSIRVLHERGSVILNEDGQPIRLIGTCQDVTERRRVEELLEENRRRFQAVFENALDPMVLIDDGARYVDANPATCKLLGYSREELLRMTVWNVTLPEDCQRVQEWLKNLLSDGTQTGEVTLVSKGGAPREIEYRSVANILPGIHLCAHRDITDSKRTLEKLRQSERGLRESQQLLRMVLATLPVGVLVTDRAADVILDNPAYKRIWGDVIASGRERWAQSKGFWHESGQRIEAEDWASARALLKGQTSLNELIDIETFDGQPKTIQNSAAPIRDAEGSIVGAVIVNEDVTERVRAQKALRESADRLQHLSRRLLDVQEDERRHLARELHDEVGQLLTGLQLLLNPNGNWQADAVQARFEQARAIVHDLLEKVRGLSFDLRPAVLDQLGLNPALRELFENYTRQTGVRVRFKHKDAEKRLAPEVETTAYRIVQEALTNVARHADVKEVIVGVWATQDLLSVQIEDRGRGFDPEAVPAASRSVGLAGMRERARLLNGELTIDSRPDGGTQITAELPLGQPRNAHDNHLPGR